MYFPCKLPAYIEIHLYPAYYFPRLHTEAKVLGSQFSRPRQPTAISSGDDTSPQNFLLALGRGPSKPHDHCLWKPLFRDLDLDRYNASTKKMFIISGARTPRGIGIICGLSNGSFALPVFSASSRTIRTAVLRKGSPRRIPPASHYKLIRRNNYSTESSLNQGFSSQKRPKNFKLLQNLQARVTSTASKLPPGSQGSHSFGSRFSHKIQSSYYFRPRTWFTSGIILLASAAAFTAMSARDFITLTDAESLNAFCPEDDVQLEIESFINSHPLTKSLRQNPSFTESRPALKVNESYRSSSLTSGVLSGPGKIVVPPFVWSEEGGKSLVSIFYLGSDLCGHPGIVHGGLLATLLDEGLARCSFPALPNRIGMTANLTINYRRPSPARSFVVLRAKTVKVEGRKAWVEGHIETLVKEGEKPVILVEATALMIEPKQAKMLKTLIPVPV